MGRILSSLYTVVLSYMHLNSQICSQFVCMKVACDLVRWAGVCPTTSCVSETGFSSAERTSAAPCQWPGEAFTSARGQAGCQPPLCVHGARLRCRAPEALAGVRGICSPSAGLKPCFGARCAGVTSELVTVSVMHLRDAMPRIWLPSLMSAAEYSDCTDAKFLVKVSRC